VFLATQFARRDKLTDEEYRRFGMPYDMIVLDAVRGEADFVLLHIHGAEPMFDLMASLGVDIVNWHDRETAPSLSEGLARMATGAICGGIARGRPLAYGEPEEVVAQIEDAVTQTKGRRLIVGAGCVTLVSTPDSNIRAACQAAAEHRYE
jgi:uroporphyrinogen decarboxylase